ncbi:MAG: acylphosphatase [Deltaproteobacteria bacterium]|nr:acylphosphatase [Deltaproteobacteria bacterium]
MVLKRAHVVIEGLVQGVFFRANTVEVSRANGVFGWVRNNQNGDVEAVFEGNEEAIKKVIEWCRIGPPAARVENVRVEWEPFKNEFDSFTAITRHNAY